jgi:hypothetical protein
MKLTFYSQIFIIFVILQFCNIPIVNFSYDEKTQETQTAKQLKLQDDSVFATSVPLSDNTACAAFTSTPECAHYLYCRYSVLNG